MDGRMKITLALACALSSLAVACNFGRVGQGRAVAYDKQQGLVTLVQESDLAQAGRVQYALPAVTVKVPENPKEMGPAPHTGRLLRLDSRNRELLVFDPASASLKTIAFTPVKEEAGVFGDDPRLARMPLIDRQAKAITLYSAGERKLITFTVADEYLQLPEDTWKAGDEVRYYYKQPGQALRMMNVTRTDVRKGG
jgi:hypothetical protein